MLLEILKSLRKEISQREGVPPFMIFHDSTLKELSEYMPADKDSLLKIKGVGERKAEVYGDRFIDTINKYIEDNHLERENHRKDYEENNIHNEVKVKTHIITYNLYKEGKSLDEIVKERNLSIVTIQQHLFKCLDEGMDVNIDDFIPKDYEEIILNAIKKIGGNKLKPIKEVLPPEVDYMWIKSVWYKHMKEKIG